MKRVRTSALLFAAAILAVAGCAVDPYCVNCPDGGDQPRPDAVVPDGSHIDGSGDGCVSTDEACDGEDNDCDGEIDEEVVGVGSACGIDRGRCRKGVLTCEDGELSCNGAINPAPEACDGVDNDCDGTIDDGNPGGGALCGTAIGECEQGVSDCQNGSIVCIGETPPDDEECDGRDNDCNGEIDDGNPGGGQLCNDGIVGCAVDVLRCRGGTLQCVGSLPMPESCDGFDNDCDSETDEGYDLTSDPLNCGDCNASCARPDARTRCSAGECEIEACGRNHWDVDGDVDNGCEYVCTLRGQEICNGIDDDCDRNIDETLTPPMICPSVGACMGTMAVCMGADRWKCVFDDDVSTNADGEIIPENGCDDVDNDCNGVDDDGFPAKDGRCTRGLGVCQTAGALACNAAGDGLQCTAAAPGAPGVEVCDGLDNDCDGELDEDVPDLWTPITVGGRSLEIYTYEASRPDASATSLGAMSHRPCSIANRLPWVNVTYPEAVAACSAIGARLCTEGEWQGACEAGSGCRWAYGAACNDDNGDTCNGNEFDSDDSRPFDQDALYPTGSPQFPMCFARWGAGASQRVYDLSGNVKEWTRARSSGVNPLRGGAYNNPEDGLECDASFEVASDTYLFSDVGFRCCRD